MSDTSKSPMELSPAAPSPSPSPSPDPQLADPSSSELGSEEANTLNLSNVSSSCSTSRMDISSASMVVNVSCESAASEEKSLEPKRKKIKLSATQRKVLAAERDRVKQEREQLRQAAFDEKLKKEREKLEKEQERLKAAELKAKQKEEEKREREAERERKAAEAAEKKAQAERERLEKLQQKEEERERKEREKAAKEQERLQQREAKELEKARRLEEKKAEEERKKLEEERKKAEEEKKLDKSRNLMRNFFHQRKSKSELNSDANSPSASNDGLVGSPAKDGLKQQQKEYDVAALIQQITSQSVPEEELYLKQLLSGKITPWSAPERKLQQQQQQQAQQVDDDCVLIDETKEEGISVFLQFFENVRPAYFGRRHQPLPLVTLNGRTPFKKEPYLDYEVDSDEEWEEEGPGESLSGSESEVEKADKDDYEIDDKFFVPHGYLSEDEAALGDDDDDSELDREAKHPSGPLMKEQALLAERSAKFTNKLTPQVVGCIWAADKEAKSESVQYREQLDFLAQFKAVRIPAV